MENIPKAGLFGTGKCPDRLHTDEMIEDFVTSQMMIAEVEDDWPEGKTTNSKNVTRRAQLLRDAIKALNIENITVFQRGKRIFMQKTIVRKLDQ